MSRIFWDTNLYIYLFEGHEPFLSQVRSLRQKMLRRGDELLTSTMTLGEVQVGPQRADQAWLGEKYRDTIAQSCTVLPFDTKAADIYASLRRNPAIKPPDAIQLSCAAAAGVELFVTNDTQLHKLSVAGIHFITPLTSVPIA